MNRIDTNKRQSVKDHRLKRRRARVRGKVHGTAERPRLSVRRSIKHIYAQLIDDVSGRTLAASSSVALKLDGNNVEAATQVGKALAEKAQAAKIEACAFDRGGRLYHGRVKALAEAAREAGLKF
jgi:large subunit ribosomal protein L18